ncbi:hypothetical protein, partial [Staphylococcus hyicus]
LYMIWNPFYILNYEGADIVIATHALSFSFLIISTMLCIFDKMRRDTWVLSIILALVMMFIATPILLFLYFFGIPFILEACLSL